MVTTDFEEFARAVNNDPWLVHRGRYLNVNFLLASGDEHFLIEVCKGRIESIERGPFVMSRWTFAMKASTDVWDKFTLAKPVPRYHDLMALIRFKYLTVEGDQHPFMANLLYFKDVFSYLRKKEASV